MTTGIYLILILTCLIHSSPPQHTLPLTENLGDISATIIYSPSLSPYSDESFRGRNLSLAFLIKVCRAASFSMPGGFYHPVVASAKN